MTVTYTDAEGHGVQPVIVIGSADADGTKTLGVDLGAFTRAAITLLSDSSGDQTTYSGECNGLVVAFYVSVGTLDVGTDLTITEEDTGAAILTLTNVAASARYMPRLATHDSVGVATGGLDAVPVNGRIKVVMAQGGNIKTGTLYVWVDGQAS